MPEIGNRIVKADFNLIYESFDALQSESYNLSIQTESDRLSFCIFNAIVKKNVVVRSYPLYSVGDLHALVNECNVIFENNDLLRLMYKSSGHLWISPRCTLVPEHLYDPHEADVYLTFNHRAIVGELTMQNHIKSARLYSVFSCPQTLVDLLRRFQPNITCYHHATPLIESVFTRISSSDEIGLAVYFYSNCLDIVVVDKNQLLFYNTFQITAPEDSVYYLAGVSNLFNINLPSTKLLYAGNFEHIPPEIAILEKYVESIVENNFFNLINLYGCE